MPKQSGKRTRQEEIQEAAREAMAAAAATAGADANATAAAAAAADAEMPPLGVGGAASAHQADMNAIAAAVANDVAAAAGISGLEHAHQAAAAAAAAEAVAATATAAGEAAAAAFIADQSQPMKRSRIDQIVGLGTGMEIDPHSQADLLQYAPSQAASSKRSETWFNHFERLKAFREETGQIGRAHV